MSRQMVAAQGISQQRSADATLLWSPTQYVWERFCVPPPNCASIRSYSPSRFMGGGGGGALAQDASQASGLLVSYPYSGGQQQKKITGTTRDSTGAVLGSCIVQGFRTSDDLFAGQMTSDTAGYFEFCTSMTENHYLVAYKAGSPDVAGTTVNTLVPV